MMSLLNPILAQAAAAPEEVTVGGIITGVMFMMTAIGSLAMIIVWVLRYSQSGHALPAARRGVLRVPWGLTLVALVLSILFMIMVIANSFIDQVPVVNNITTGGAATVEQQATQAESTPETTETASIDGTTDDGKDKTAKSGESGMTPEKMQDALLQTIAMDLVMLLSFGAVILVASKAGRVYLTETKTPYRQATGRSASTLGPAGGTATTGREYSSPWPDLDDASAIPQMQGYDILGSRSVQNPNRNAFETEEKASGVTTSPSTSDSPLHPDSPLYPDSVEKNPFAFAYDDNPFGSDPKVDSPTSGETSVPDESFSFTRELRFAGEVFLAAYVPTTALRLLIVLISVGIWGEMPKSHPFLEMLDDGVSVAMIAMILVMAAFVAPIVEELQFRVVVLGGIAQLGLSKLALIVSSILFAFAHGFPDSIALLPLAFALGYTYLRRRSYVTVMLVHFLFNGFNMILALVALL
ncbi:MAG: CPBP family intramembrane metalloprotease [Planctomycetota bacterium]|nr:CPBP family intramembrane metalloprotease [Planctomycetota bacterium]